MFFFIVRYYFLRIIVPRGTDCTDLIEYFDLSRAFLFIFHQIMYLLGINLGPEYLCASNFFNTNADTKVVIIISALVLLSIIAFYIYRKKKGSDNSNDKDYYDLLFILYIFLAILESSLTIRVELRFLYARFMCLMIYVAYMLTYMFRDLYVKTNFAVVALYTLFFATRMFMSFYFKEKSISIYVVNEQKVVNSLYEATVEKYGVENIKKKTILMTSNVYRTIIGEEMTHFFDQFDRKISDRQIIYFVDDLDRIQEAMKNDDEMILVESENFKYQEVK